MINENEEPVLANKMQQTLPYIQEDLHIHSSPILNQDGVQLDMNMKDSLLSQGREKNINLIAKN